MNTALAIAEPPQVAEHHAFGVPQSAGHCWRFSAARPKHRKRSAEAERAHRSRLLKARGRRHVSVTPQEGAAIRMLLLSGRISEADSRDPAKVAAALTLLLDDVADCWKDSVTRDAAASRAARRIRPVVPEDCWPNAYPTYRPRRS